MTAKAIIFHGTGGHPEVVWYPWLGRRLADRGYAVEIPHYPDLNVEPIDTFLPKVLASHEFDEQTVLVGHSGGAALLLALLEHLDTTVSQAILVAGYSTRPNTDEEPVLQPAYDWAAIRASVRDIYFVNSRRDPYGCDERQGRAMFERLGGTQIVRDDGHFGDADQPYESFELLDRLIP
ncbi:alpha/beta hydrolase [Plantactinospora sp. BB1]|uniref:RBBP9/YdeN family alpha/beta hydrolase n=1 Tax=Plantactinospora sp. BB1 TaxID=2071627 RepID=UPI000D167DD2|nr:alpha/beta fold hydrolase [Plantactinospora sp. BB1]AVT40562.1 alpha/beta hydrolase [Plantactinospora sp. BB1]